MSVQFSKFITSILLLIMESNKTHEMKFVSIYIVVLCAVRCNPIKIILRMILISFLPIFNASRYLNPNVIVCLHFTMIYIQAKLKPMSMGTLYSSVSHVQIIRIQYV